MASDTHESVPGLKGKFPTDVRIVGLGRGATIRGQAPDFNLEFAECDIQTGDIELLTRELNLKETTLCHTGCTGGQLRERRWFNAFKTMKPGSTDGR